MRSDNSHLQKNDNQTVKPVPSARGKSRKSHVKKSQTQSSDISEVSDRGDEITQVISNPRYPFDDYEQKALEEYETHHFLS